MSDDFETVAMIARGTNASRKVVLDVVKPHSPVLLLSKAGLNLAGVVYRR
jgi:hypothetical protein